jgi:hypothetical protein
MGVKRTGYVPPKVPGYVTYWVGKEVLAPTSSEPKRGYVTSVRAQSVGGQKCIYAHVAIHDGPMVYCPVKALLVLADRSSEHGKQDELGQPFDIGA